MGGYELARSLRALPELGRLHLVALTGLALGEQQRHAATEAGFTLVLCKPTSPGELRSLLAVFASLEGQSGPGAPAREGG
jgi:CheY-like chemotaxis protein